MNRVERNALNKELEQKYQHVGLTSTGVCVRGFPCRMGDVWYLMRENEHTGCEMIAVTEIEGMKVPEA